MYFICFINIVPFYTCRNDATSVTGSMCYIFLYIAPILKFLCVFYSLKKLMSLSARTGRPFTPAVSLWAQWSVRSSETTSILTKTGQWTSGQRAKEENLHTISLWGKLVKVKVYFQNGSFPRHFKNAIFNRLIHRVFCCEHTCEWELHHMSFVTYVAN